MSAVALSLPAFPPDLLAALARQIAPGTPVTPIAGGRTNRVFAAGQVVVKLYQPQAASPLFPNDAEAEARALSVLAPFGLAPALRGKGPGWLICDAVSGRTWRRDPAAAANALSRLHNLDPLPHGFRPLPMGGKALAADARRVAAHVAGLPPLPDSAALTGLPAPRLVHGDAVAGNMIEGPGGVVLIDWQCPGLGDPVEDLAAFLSPAMQSLYRGAPLNSEERAAFLTAYGERETLQRYHALAPVLHWRLAAHCLWRAARGDAGYAEAARLELAAL